jgi:hypothetical protein
VPENALRQWHRRQHWVRSSTDRPADKLAVIANELEAETRPNTDIERRRLLHTLTRERFGKGGPRRA